MAVAAIGPMPGIVISRAGTSSSLARLAISRSSSMPRPASAVHHIDEHIEHGTCCLRQVESRVVDQRQQLRKVRRAFGRHQSVLGELGACGGLVIRQWVPTLGFGTVPLVVFGLTLLVMSLQAAPRFNLLACYFGLIQFVVAGLLPAPASVAVLIGASALGALLALACAEFQRRLAPR